MLPYFNTDICILYYIIYIFETTKKQYTYYITYARNLSKIKYSNEISIELQVVLEYVNQKCLHLRPENNRIFLKRILSYSLIYMHLLIHMITYVIISIMQFYFILI